MQPSGLTTEIFGEMIEVDVYHIHTKNVPQDGGLLVPIVVIGSIIRWDFYFSLRGRF